ncbi:MAG: hypothetical protein Q8R08_04785 [bacterium]|nr:hypothetical protein [bacterium]
MKNNRRRAATRELSVKPIGVWQVLNEPVVELSEEAVTHIFMALAVILLAVWIAPYWGQESGIRTQELGVERWGGMVAGAQIESQELGIMNYELGQTPEWYYVASSVPTDVASAFSEAANEVLDISGTVSQIAEFYEPGADAVWNAWLDLMADPY